MSTSESIAALPEPEPVGESSRRQLRDERRARLDDDDVRSLRERVADSRWRRRIAAARPVDNAYRIVVGLAGLLVLGLGVLLIPLPGPGWVIVFAGLAIWATEFTWAERLLQFARRHVRAWTEWVLRQPLWVRGVVALLTAAFVYGVLVVTLHLTGVPDWMPGWVPLWR